MRFVLVCDVFLSFRHPHDFSAECLNLFSVMLALLLFNVRVMLVSIGLCADVCVACWYHVGIRSNTFPFVHMGVGRGGLFTRGRSC